MFAVCCLFHAKNSTHFKKMVAKKNILEDHPSKVIRTNLKCYLVKWLNCTNFPKVDKFK